MALHIPLPKQILTHAHWTLGKRKMAKSTGNVVNPFFAMDRFGVDAIRFYMAYDGGIQDDADYENHFITERYRKCLHGGIGGLASRVIRSKAWDIREAIGSRTPENLGQTSLHGQDAQVTELHRDFLTRLPSIASKHFEDLDSGAAVRVITDLVFDTNAYLQNIGPWDKTRLTKPERMEILFLCAESLRICGILLQPYMPGKMSELLDTLGVSPGRRKFADTAIGADLDYGTPPPEIKARLGKGIEGSLFPPLTIEWPDKIKGLPSQLRNI